LQQSINNLLGKLEYDKSLVATKKSNYEILNFSANQKPIILTKIPNFTGIKNKFTLL